MEENNTKPIICAACLQCSLDCFEMISTRLDKSDQKSPTYLECYKACTQLDIDDGQSRHICSSCSNDLLGAYNFIAKARHSYAVFMGVKVSDLINLEVSCDGDSQTFLTMPITEETQIKQELMDAQRNNSWTNEARRNNIGDEISLGGGMVALNNLIYNNLVSKSSSENNLFEEEIQNSHQSAESNENGTEEVIQRNDINSEEYIAEGNSEGLILMHEFADFHRMKDLNCNSFSESFPQSNHKEERKKRKYERRQTSRQVKKTNTKCHDYIGPKISNYKLKLLSRSDQNTFLKKKREAERLRRERIRKDPEAYKKYCEKEKERNERRKQERKLKKLNQLTEEEKLSGRQKQNTNKRKSRRNQKNNNKGKQNNGKAENVTKSQKPYSYSKTTHMTKNMNMIPFQNKVFNREEMNSDKTGKQKHKLQARIKRAAYMRKYRARKKTEKSFFNNGNIPNEFHFSSEYSVCLASATTPLNESSNLIQVDYSQEQPSLSVTSEFSDPHNTTSSLDSYKNQIKRVLSDTQDSEIFLAEKLLGETCSNGVQTKKPLSGADRVRNYRARKKLTEAANTVKKEDPLSVAKRSRNCRDRKKNARDMTVVQESTNLSLPKKMNQLHYRELSTIF